MVESTGVDSRANCALGLPRSRTSTGSSLCAASPSSRLCVTEFEPQYFLGGKYRARTCDPLLVRQMLSQLS